jgi:hopanoid biosynthesis associated radical SAM protein HpnH
MFTLLEAIMRFPLKQSALIARYLSEQKRAGIKRFPLVLMLEPLFACNFTCSGCGRIHEYKDHMSEALSLDQCLRAIDECGAPVVSVCGGEPLLYPHIKELVEKTIERNRVVYLCTNGWLLDKKLGQFEPHPLFNINVHIDGTEKVHDVIVEKEGAYDKAVENIRKAKALGFTVCTNTTVYKQTSVEDVLELMERLRAVGIDGMLFSPGFDYKEVPDQTVFLDRSEINDKFKALRKAGAGKGVWSTPMFLDFLAGKRDYECTPWGNVTYNVKGWKAPCYLITDGHHATYDEFINGVEWTSYGPENDKRCRNCMCHCGFEPTVALTAGDSLKDSFRMARWMLR